MQRDQKGIFDHLERMMFAFGDDAEPLEESYALMESILVEFIDRYLRKAMRRSHVRGMYNKIIKDDLLFLIKDNPKYIYRIAYIIQSSQVVDKLKKQTDDKH